jgi:hypothetical protein
MIPNPIFLISEFECCFSFEVLGTVYRDIYEERNHIPDEERGSVCYVGERNGLQDPKHDIDDDEGSKNQRMRVWVNFRAQ